MGTRNHLHWKEGSSLDSQFEGSVTHVIGLHVGGG